MTKYSDYYDQIRSLRGHGYTYSEICSALGIVVPKSTLTFICREVELPENYSAKIRQLTIQNLKTQRVKALTAKQKEREAYLGKLHDNARKVVAEPSVTSAHTLKVALAMLYLGEGAKWYGHRGLQLGSSDPLIVRLYIKLLLRCYRVSPESVHCRIIYHADQDIEELTDYWSEVTHVPPNKFYKTKPDPRSHAYATRKSSYQGVCVVSCAGTAIQQELQFIAEEIEKDIKGL